MKKYAGLLFPLILPYIFVLGMGGILFFDGKICETVFNGRFDIFLMSIGGVLIFSLLSTLVTAVIAVKRKWSAAEVAKANMIVKMLQIPAYILIFISGIYFSFAMMLLTPLAGILFIIFDCVIIFMTGVIGAVAAWRCRKEGNISTEITVLLAISQFIFCIDVVCSVLMFIMAGRKENKE